MGSYLLLVRALGRAETRLPFRVPRRGRVALAPGSLPAEEDVPPGFVLVPAGPHPSGGEVGTFLAARFELTFADWWAFLNDPRTLAEIAAHRETGWRFVPRIGGEPMVARNPSDGSFVPPPAPERPLAHVSLFDVAGYVVAPPGEAQPRDEQYVALSRRLQDSQVTGPDAPWSYLRWRTETARERTKDGRRFVFTLPSAQEWERLAGGADARRFPYGDEREWLFFKGARSRRTNPASEPVGLFPDDESVFGARDLTGSVSEWTLDWKEVGSLFLVKGSSWGSQEADDDLVLARRALPPGTTDPTVGVRLVVRRTEPAPPAPPAEGPR
jgi:formylglycine-generating enzyme required for sulfatase activity